MSKLTLVLILASPAFILARHAGAQVDVCNGGPIDLALNFMEGPTEITSPNYPQDYPDNCEVRWSISNQYSGWAVTFQLLDFDLESGFDHLRIFESGNLLANFTGTYDPLPGIVVAYSGEMEVEFNTDQSISRKGFQAEVMSLLI